MFEKKSIDDHFGDLDKQFRDTKKTIKAGFIGAGIGFAAGASGGIYLGESVNEYVEVLKQAPVAIRYAVDGVFTIVVGGVGAGIGRTIAQLPGMYKIFKRS